MDISHKPSFADKIQLPESLRPTFMAGVSASMRTVEAAIRELTQSDVPVLLLAENGAGKRTIARRVHDTSSRAQRQFRILTCDSLDRDNFDSGCLASLSGEGTVYFDEIGDLDSTCQAKLLDALSDGVEHKGSGDGVRAHLICGSARDLEADVKAGRFREDLYYRVSGVCLRLPPLRQRKEDIPFLMDFFIKKYAHEFDRPSPEISAKTLQLFQDYAWPGNIRELEDAAKAIVALGDEAVAMGGLRALLMKSDRNGNGDKVSLKQVARDASREAEKELILKALNRTRWNRRRAAAELQISYKALLYKLKQIGYEYGAS